MQSFELGSVDEVPAKSLTNLSLLELLELHLGVDDVLDIAALPVYIILSLLAIIDLHYLAWCLVAWDALNLLLGKIRHLINKQNYTSIRFL